MEPPCLTTPSLFPVETCGDRIGPVSLCSLPELSRWRRRKGLSARYRVVESPCRFTSEEQSHFSRRVPQAASERRIPRPFSELDRNHREPPGKVNSNTLCYFVCLDRILVLFLCVFIVSLGHIIVFVSHHTCHLTNALIFLFPLFPFNFDHNPTP